jgi:hypothetical protein
METVENGGTRPDTARGDLVPDATPLIDRLL